MHDGAHKPWTCSEMFVMFAGMIASGSVNPFYIGQIGSDVGGMMNREVERPAAAVALQSPQVLGQGFKPADKVVESRK